MTPQDLLAAARSLMQRPDTPAAPAAGIWPRAAALLTRQAIEMAMAEIWASKRHAAELSGSSLRSQVLCLRAYLDPGAASRAAYLIAALSHACHYHPYELAPTAAELTGWLDQAAKLVPQMQAASAAPASQQSPRGYKNAEERSSEQP